MKVKLSEVMEAIEGAGDDMTYYYHTDTQSITYVMEYGDDDERLAEIEEHCDHYIQLPSKYDVNDYHIMEEFIWDLADEQQQNQLENAISGRGAFRYFRDLVERFELTQKWYDFREAAYEKIAREWCHDEKIAIAAE